MAEKNKKLEIASAIVGGIYAAINAIPAMHLVAEAASSGGVNTEGTGILALFLYSVQFIGFMFVFAAVAFAIVCLALVILPLVYKNPSARRKIAIAACILLSFRMLIDICFVFGIVVNGFRDGDYLIAIMTILSAILTIAWFVLNIIRAKIYKVGKGENQ